jgi:hypothetical protein
MQYTIDYYDKTGEHCGCSALLAFTGKVYSHDYLTKMAKEEIKGNFFPGASYYEISTQDDDECRRLHEQSV